MNNDKLNMQSVNGTAINIENIAALFPHCVTESAEGKKIDFDLLKQELSADIVEGNKERYRLEWPGKREAIVTANTPINKTLRPVREDSVDFDTTENIYIEGDNLEVLKLLQESYLGKIKMIYIDPPYNTGKDFVYKDNFAKSSEEELAESGQKDEYGQRLVPNPETSGRYHSDWLSMMYPRLKLARNLLTEDGVIFISIDENEIHNIRKICDEIFGEVNFISQLGWQKVYSPKNQARHFSNDYEFVLCYSKNIEKFKINLLPRTEKMNARYTNPDNDPRGDWKAGDCVGAGERKNGYYDIVSPKSGKVFNVTKGKHWVYAPETMKKMIEENRIWFGKDGNSFPSVKQFLTDVSGRRPSSLLLYEDYGHTDMAKKDLIKLFSDLEKVPFDTPKPVKLVKMLSIIGANENDIILDFFAGSGTTAQSVLELNAETNRNLKFILIQIGEEIADNEGATKIGIYTISDLVKERIRRAAKAVVNDKLSMINDKKGSLEKMINASLLEVDGIYAFPEHAIIDEKAETALKEINHLQLTINHLDTGFRVYRLDSSNVKDVYYTPQELNQGQLEAFADNVKEDRTAEDLVTQVMLDWGLELSLPIERKTIAGKEVYAVAGDSLYCCFDQEIDEAFAKEIAKDQPMRIVFRDNSFKDDTAKENVKQLLKQLTTNTEMKVV